MDRYVIDRDKALLSLDKNKIIKCFKKYKIPYPADEKVFWASVHKSRLYITSISEEEKNKSRLWLVENGFSPFIYNL